MKRLSFVILMSLAASILGAQDLDDILRKTNVAIGTEARSKIMHMQSNGHFVMAGTEAKMPFKLLQSKPGKIRLESTIIGLKAIQTYDGVSAWLLNPTQGVDAKPADPEDMEFISATTAIDGPFVNRADNRVPNFIGTKQYRGAPCFVVRIAKSMEEHIDYYINTRSYLISAVRYEYKKNGGWYSMEYKVEAWLDFEGAAFPSEITVFLTGVEMTSIYVTRMKKLEEVNPNTYQKPSY